MKPSSTILTQKTGKEEFLSLDRKRVKSLLVACLKGHGNHRYSLYIRRNSTDVTCHFCEQAEETAAHTFMSLSSPHEK